MKTINLYKIGKMPEANGSAFSGIHPVNSLITDGYTNLNLDRKLALKKTCNEDYWRIAIFDFDKLKDHIQTAFFP